MINEEIFNKIKQEQSLECSFEEFNTYYNNLEDLNFEINYSFHSFEEPYNGTKIENVTNNTNAIYYVLTINNVNYLQYIKPFVSGLQPITEENKMEVINDHIKVIKEQMNNRYKLEETINHFKENGN